MSTRVTDAELVEAFVGQADRCTHSGQLLGDCFSASQFDLAFQYGSVVQRSAIRHALIACLSLPAPDPCADLPVRYATFEKHLENLLLHTLKSVAGDMQVARPERVAANLLVEAAWFRNNFEVAARSPPAGANAISAGPHARSLKGAQPSGAESTAEGGVPMLNNI